MSNMDNVVVRIFDELMHAETARGALIAAGFSAAGIELISTNDEAGPVEGNFVLEYKDKEPMYSHKPSVFDPARIYGDNPNDGLGHAPVVWRSTHMLTIVIEEPDSAAQAAAIAEQHGGIDVDRVTSQASSPVVSVASSRPLF